MSPTSFQISPLDRGQFAHLFTLTDEELARHRAIRRTVTEKPGFPCRISLADAEIGESVILVHYEHLPVETPFRASHAVYVRPHAQPARPAPGEVPAMLRSRTLSLRGFDRTGMLAAADLAPGETLEPAIGAILADPRIAFIHLHFAKPGCYAARVDRLAP